MIDHVNLPVSDLASSLAFYEPVLAALGYPVLMRDADAIGFGVDAWSFGIVQAASSFPALHVAFRAQTHASVHAFHAAALKAGARCNGLPGPRPQYGPNYHAAFVLDPDGHNLEAVCRG